MYDKLQSTLRGGVSLSRLLAALGRRLKAAPDNLAYQLWAKPGSVNYQRLSRFQNLHQGQRAFILGNGPSLAGMDLTRVDDEFSFGLNRIYLNFERSPFRPTYHVCMNDLVLAQSAEEIASLSMPRFINWRKRNLFSEDSEIQYLRESYRPHFATDIREGIWVGATVTFAALQIAYYMGFEQVILIGVDHSFASQGTPNETIVSAGPDPNHFHPDYFPKGFRWQLPDLATSELAYRMARQAYQADGRQVLDATIGGQLNVFPKIEFNKVLRSESADNLTEKGRQA